MKKPVVAGLENEELGNKNPPEQPKEVVQEPANAEKSEPAGSASSASDDKVATTQIMHVKGQPIPVDVGAHSIGVNEHVYRPHPFHSHPPPLHGHYPEPTIEVKQGSKSAVKELYKGPPKCECCTNWVEEPPEGMTKVHTTKAKWGEYAVVVRKTSHGGDQTWKLFNVTVNSQYVLNILRKHLAQFPGLSLEADEVIFTPPFVPLHYSWSEIVATAEERSSGKDAEHFQLFKEVMEPELKVPAKQAEDCARHGKIEFSALWTIFKPGSLIYWDNDDQPNVARLKESSYGAAIGGSFFNLRAEQVDFNGIRFGYREVYRMIWAYKGYKPISEYTMPLEMRRDKSDVMERLLERGKKFEALRGYHFRLYTGGKSPSQSVRDRVVVDATKYFENRHPHLDPLKKPALEEVPVLASPMQNPHNPFQNSVAPPPMPPGYVQPAYTQPAYAPSPRPRGRRIAPQSRRRDMYAGPVSPEPEPLPDTPTEVPPLSDEEALLCVPTVPAFVLRTKNWEMLDVDEITEISWENIFESLVLPNQVKDLLFAFALSKTTGETKFDDFVGGKGKGIIMLLSGPPGVGKTLTAEAISEKLHVPLYTLSAGELGSVASNVEQALLSAMEKCTRWNAVLLLDECDVFLEKRELNSLKRNELVSIFLRLVEYYEGIMVLTTNRVAPIDPAFNSRIDVAIQYDDLNADLRLQVWENFIAKLQSEGAAIDKDSLKRDALMNLAEHELNGRQIKSLVKTALLLANSKDQALGVEHLDTVVGLNRLRDKRLRAE